MSLTTGQIIASVQSAYPNEWSGPQIASVLAFITGFIVLGAGLLRIGWLVEFIPIPAVSGFMTGSAINIAAGQVPGLLGITGFEWVVFIITLFIHDSDNLHSVPVRPLTELSSIP